MTTGVLDHLDAARARTLALLAPFDDATLTSQHSPLMSPLVWDLAHIAHYEELWLLRELGRGDATDARFDDVYDAFKHPRAERPTLELLDPDQARAFGAAVRERVRAAWSGAASEDQRVEALLTDDFVARMVIRHEHQHVETMLATVQLMADGAPPAAGDGPGRPSADPNAADREVVIPAGPFVMGTDTDPWAYDNERPARAVQLPAFRIDATPVTNERYTEFVEAGGYDDPAWWSAAGWQWRQSAGLEHPEFWARGSEGWFRRRYGRVEPVPALEPVQHVCWYEADAYARWRGKRLPTEAEWEKAASWDARSRTGVKHTRPGSDTDEPTRHADLWTDGRRWGPDEVGAHPSGATAEGALDLIGGVWEWTDSDFAGHPGFVSFPYREYSEVFFGSEYRVLRGGSWATHPHAISTTFRNWDYPIRRQIFSGFRCARDA
ncbi:MAG: ergothioneine biosynthesis protein EgtB [Acidimicrobiia bacterium]